MINQFLEADRKSTELHGVNLSQQATNAVSAPPKPLNTTRPDVEQASACRHQPPITASYPSKPHRSPPASRPIDKPAPPSPLPIHEPPLSPPPPPPPPARHRLTSPAPSHPPHPPPHHPH